MESERRNFRCLFVRPRTPTFYIFAVILLLCGKYSRKKKLFFATLHPILPLYADDIFMAFIFNCKWKIVKIFHHQQTLSINVF